MLVARSSLSRLSVEMLNRTWSLSSRVTLDFVSLSPKGSSLGITKSTLMRPGNGSLWGQKTQGKAEFTCRAQHSYQQHRGSCQILLDSASAPSPPLLIWNLPNARWLLELLAGLKVFKPHPCPAEGILSISRMKFITITLLKCRLFLT